MAQSHTVLNFRSEQLDLYKQLSLIVVQRAKPGDDIEQMAAQVMEDYNRAYTYFWKQGQTFFSAFGDKK